MDKKPCNLGRSYLIGQLRRHGLSRRRAKPILNFIFAELSQALARGEAVEFPYGWLEREKKISRHWELVGDEPMKPYTVEHYTDAEGVALRGGLDGIEFVPGKNWAYFLPRAKTPPYTNPPRRPRGRPRKTTTERAPQRAAIAAAEQAV